MDTASQPVESCRRCPHPGCGRRVAITDLAGEGLSKCSRCRQVVYCSKDCQKAAWRDGHKHECKVLQLAAAAEEYEAFKLTAEIKAPILLLPQDCSDDSGALIVCDFGQLNIDACHGGAPAAYFEYGESVVNS